MYSYSKSLDLPLYTRGVRQLHQEPIQDIRYLEHDVVPLGLERVYVYSRKKFAIEDILSLNSLDDKLDVPRALGKGVTVTWE